MSDRDLPVSTDDRDAAERELVFAHTGNVTDVVKAFEVTFDQLYADRDTDEFEFNWRSRFRIANTKSLNRGSISPGV